MKETLAEKYTETLKAEAQKKAHMEAVKKEAKKVLEAVASGDDPDSGQQRLFLVKICKKRKRKMQTKNKK